MPVYTRAPRSRLAARGEVEEPEEFDTSDEDFTVLMPRPSAAPLSSPRPRSDLRERPAPMREMRERPIPMREPVQAPPPPPPLPTRNVERPSSMPPPVARSIPAPPPSFEPTESRTPMRPSAVAAVAMPEESTFSGWLQSRRGKMTMRATVLLAAGVSFGFLTEMIIQRRSNNEMSAEPRGSFAAGMSQSPTSPPYGAGGIPSGMPTQCTTATAGSAPPMSVAEAPAPAPTTKHHHSHRSSADRTNPTEGSATATATGSAAPSPSGTTPDGTLATDDIAAAAEALAKAKQETTLP